MRIIWNYIVRELKLNEPSIFIKASSMWLLFFVLASPFSAKSQQGLNGLIIHPENRYIMFYKKRFIMTWANNNHGAPLQTMASHKLNHYEVTHAWYDGVAPMLSGNRFPNDGNIFFNESYFSQLRSELTSARNNGIAVSIVLYNGPAFETDRTPGSRFGQNPWNACLGGPIDIGQCTFQQSGGTSSGGLKQFLTLENYDYSNPLTSRFSTYDKNWPLPRKVQYRQEEILNKIMSEIGDLDNWMFNVMWELDDQTQGDWNKARDWANWFAGYIHQHFDRNRIVMTGEVHPNANLQSRFGADFYADITPTTDGSQHEGIVSWGAGSSVNLRGIGSNNNGKPKVLVGYDPWDCDGNPADKLCNGGSGCINEKKIIDFIRDALLTEHGVHPSTPFHFLNCGAGKEKVLDYMKALQDFLETVDSWHNEPGDEIKDSTLPRADNFSFVDLPDGDGRVGWPRSELQISDSQAPSPPQNLKVSEN